MTVYQYAEIAFKHSSLIPEKEYRFYSKRKWRFDFCFPSIKCAIEIEGGVWSNGRHTRGSGFIDDCEKYNMATALGWSVFRCATTSHVAMAICFVLSKPQYTNWNEFPEPTKG
jgi:hypothetical protein